MAYIRGVRGLDRAIDAWTQRLELTRDRDTRLAEISTGTAQKVVRPGPSAPARSASTG
jgi:hypothetical protein